MKPLKGLKLQLLKYHIINYYFWNVNEHFNIIYLFIIMGEDLSTCMKFKINVLKSSKSIDEQMQNDNI